MDFIDALNKVFGKLEGYPNRKQPPLCCHRCHRNADAVIKVKVKNKGYIVDVIPVCEKHIVESNPLQVNSNVDIAVCSKDRIRNLQRCIPILSQLPHKRLCIYEGSLNPNVTQLEALKHGFGAEIVYVPKLKFGHVRALIMENLTADYVAMVDDDVELCPNWGPLLMSEFNNPNVVAVSSRIIYDWNFLRKLCFRNIRGTGESGGAAIYDRKAILTLGNFDSHIHVAEDMELKLRVNASGKKWVRSRWAYVLHPITLKQYLERPKGYAVGWKFIMRYSKSKWLFLLTRFASTFVMPIYYFLQTLDLRILGTYFLYKLIALISFLRLPK